MSFSYFVQVFPNQVIVSITRSFIININGTRTTWTCFDVEKTFVRSKRHLFNSMQLKLATARFHEHKISSDEVKYPELFWADRYIHRIHEGTTMVCAEWVHFQNCTSKCSKNALPDSVCS